MQCWFFLWSVWQVSSYGMVKWKACGLFDLGQAQLGEWVSIDLSAVGLQQAALLEVMWLEVSKF
ncbi:hypothetical protein M758_1G160400 [Ceratodon purpureus]|nr:hypothetical protein M758_1G160400 [Ceratodon purpureus]